MNDVQTGQLSEMENPLLDAGTSGNPIFKKTQQTVDLSEIEFDAIHKRRISPQRKMQMLWRRESAADALEGFEKGIEIFGFTKGQFSLMDLLKAIIGRIGQVQFSLSTWTASRAEAMELSKMHKEGDILSMRWLVDLTFTRRDPEAAHALRQTFGMDAIRVAHVHSKFALFSNDDWRIVLRTSMNLNMNPRTEDFTIAHDPELFAFIESMLDKIWSHQPAGLAKHTPSETHRKFEELK